MSNPLLPWIEQAENTAQQVENTVEQATGINLPDIVPTAQPTVVQPTATAAPAPTAAPSSVPGAPVTDLHAAIAEGIKEAMVQAVPQIKATAIEYAKQELEAELTGKSIDRSHPTITVTDAKGHELKIADAKSRSYRSFVQGLGIDIVFALTALLGTLANFDPLQKASWITLGALVLKTITQAIITYIARIKITPTATVDGDKVSLVPVPATSITTLTAPSHIS